MICALFSNLGRFFTPFAHSLAEPFLRASSLRATCVFDGAVRLHFSRTLTITLRETRFSSVLVPIAVHRRAPVARAAGLNNEISNVDSRNAKCMVVRAHGVDQDSSTEKPDKRCPTCIQCCTTHRPPLRGRASCRYALRFMFRVRAVHTSAQTTQLFFSAYSSNRPRINSRSPSVPCRSLQEFS